MQQVHKGQFLSAPEIRKPPPVRVIPLRPTGFSDLCSPFQWLGSVRDLERMISASSKRTFDIYRPPSMDTAHKFTRRK